MYKETISTNLYVNYIVLVREQHAVGLITNQSLWNLNQMLLQWIDF